tara:strand:+ start:116318 stop:116440 length:123 start_codon:yes stop_codon:yes gene_type:complete
VSGRAGWFHELRSGADPAANRGVSHHRHRNTPPGVRSPHR